MPLGVLCINLDPEMERMAQELRDVSDVGNDARGDESSHATNPRLRKTKITHFLSDVLQTAIVERYQQLKKTTVTPIRDGKSAASGELVYDRDQADGFFY